MVDLLEISLLSKLIISRSCLFSNDSCFIKLLLKYLKFIGQLGILSIDLWYFKKLAHIKSIIGLQFAPLLLEAFKSFAHAKFNEEVSEEFIGAFCGSLTICISRIVFFTQDVQLLLSLILKSVKVIQFSIASFTVSSEHIISDFTKLRNVPVTDITRSNRLSLIPILLAF